ncbi:MAG: hypothetical protein N2111_12245 [Candidatus Sumerlaeaceae bacterium]|nr:hypothetical protein [Candidatus Sumerlaeaceae bacterium]
MKVIATIVLVALVAGAGFVLLGRADTQRAYQTVQDRVTWSSEQIAKDPAGYARHVQRQAESVSKGLEAGIIDLSRQRNELLRYRDTLARNLAAGTTALRELAELRRRAQPGTTETFEWRNRLHTLAQLEEQLVSLDEQTSNCRAALTASAKTLEQIEFHLRRAEARKYQSEIAAREITMRAEVAEMERRSQALVKRIDAVQPALDSVLDSTQSSGFVPLTIDEIREQEDMRPDPDRVIEILKRY